MFLKLEHVRVITWRALKQFAHRYPFAAEPARDWYKIALKATWRNFADVRATFGQTDQLKVRSGQTVCVFDLGGNKFRLIAYVSYARQKVYVLRVLTHKEYDKGNQQWRKEL